MKLNLGAGVSPLEGWENWDRKTGQEAFPLDLPDSSCDEIRASHLLEHFSHLEVMQVLTEWVRCLRPGGLLKVAVPSWEWCKRESDKPHAEQDPQLISYLMGGQVDEDDFHACLFDAATLEQALRAVGLMDIEEWESEQEDCASLPVSLNRQGRKPGVWTEPAAVEAPEPTEIRIDAGQVRCVLTRPRFGPLDSHFAAVKALSPLGLALQEIGGVFWYQSMSELFQQHLAAGTKYLLTLDYDSIFDTSNVIELIRLLETRPEIDAACAIQMRRERDSPLFCPANLVLAGSEERQYGVTAKELREEATQIRTGHFGLTLFRLARLEGVAKPWFGAKPDSDGGYGEKRVDADIAFWHRWREAGRTLYLANRCAIGHLEVVITWPDRSFHAHHQHISEWVKGGKPAEAWR